MNQNQHIGFWSYINIGIDLILFSLSTLVEVSPSLPQWIGKSRRLVTLSNMTLGLWLILTVVLVNAYKGILTSDLTSPPPMTQRWHTFQELEGFTYYAPKVFQFTMQQFGSVNQFQHPRSTVSDYIVTYIEPLYACHCLLQFKTDLFDHTCPFYMDNDVDEVEACNNTLTLLDHIGLAEKVHYLDSSFCNKSEYMCRMWILIRPKEEGQNQNQINTRLRLKPTLISSRFLFKNSETFFDSDIRQFITGCKGTAYVDYDQVLDGFIANEKIETGRLTTKYKKGKQKFFETWTGFYFTRDLPFQLYQRLQLILASGIYQIWESWYAVQFPNIYQKMVHESNRLFDPRLPVPLHLGTNAFTGFIILSVGLAIGGLFFLCEFVLWHSRVMTDAVRYLNSVYT
jgi:hypothetical protein